MLVRRWSLVAVLAFCALALTGRLPGGIAAAGWRTDGVPVAPADSAQIRPWIVPDGAGGAIIVWEDRRGGRFWAYAQRLTAAGSVAFGWPATGVSLPHREWSQSNVRAIADGAGGAYIASDETLLDGAVWLSHLRADGAPSSGWPENGVMVEGTGGRQGGHWGNHVPALELDRAGGAYLSWTYRDRLNEQIRLDRVTASGVASAGWGLGGIYAGALPGNGSPWEYPSGLCQDGDDGVFVAFQQNGYPDVFVQRFREDRTAVFSAGIPVTSTTHRQSAPGIVTDGSGGAIVVWEDRRNGLFDQVYAQHILADGTYAPGWPDTGLAIATYPTDAGIAIDFYFTAALSSIVSDGTGGAYVAWTDYRERTSTGEGDIYAQHLLGGGVAPGWPANGLPVCAAPGDQRQPTLATDGEGGVLISWQDARDGEPHIYVERLASSGSLADGWPSNGLAVVRSGVQEAPVVTGDRTGGALIAWVDGRRGIPNIFAARVTPDGVVPVLVSVVSVEALPDRARLAWQVAGLEVIHATVSRRADGLDWTPIATTIPDEEGRIVFEDRDVVPGARYDYRLGILVNGREVFAGEASARIPGPARLDRPNPNPASDMLDISFELPSGGPATLELIDLAGRRVASREISSLGAGPHVARLGEVAMVPAGIYLVRLTQGSLRLTRRTCVVH